MPVILEEHGPVAVWKGTGPKPRTIAAGDEGIVRYGNEVAMRSLLIALICLVALLMVGCTTAFGDVAGCGGASGCGSGGQTCVAGQDCGNPNSCPVR